MAIDCVLVLPISQLGFLKTRVNLSYRIRNASANVNELAPINCRYGAKGVGLSVRGMLYTNRRHSEVMGLLRHAMAITGQSILQPI